MASKPWFFGTTQRTTSEPGDQAERFAEVAAHEQPDHDPNHQAAQAEAGTAGKSSTIIGIAAEPRPLPFSRITPDDPDPMRNRADRLRWIVCAGSQAGSSPQR